MKRADAGSAGTRRRFRCCSLSENFEECLAAAKKVLAGGGAIVYPTDTAYGIGANALDAKAVEKVFLMKKREGKPISILVHGLADVEKYCELDERQKELLAELLPGPYTIVLNVKKGAGFPETVSSAGKIGVRVPNHFFARVLSRELGFPLTATSANLSGAKSPVSAAEVDAEIAGKAGLVVDGGETAEKNESTVLDLSGPKPAVLRKGAGYEKAKSVLGIE